MTSAAIEPTASHTAVLKDAPGSSAPGPSAPGPSAPREAHLSPAGLLVVLGGAFLAIADYFIVNVALADIGNALHASDGTLELVVAGYGMAYAVLLVLGGRIGDAVGRRRLFLAGMAAFTITSLVCGLAPSIWTLVGARVLQGASAAAMVPQVLATIQATTTGPRRVRALGLFGATAGIAGLFGQLAGGWLVSADLFGGGWRPIFLLNVPVGVVAFVSARRLVPDSRAHRPTPIDVPGTVLLGATLLALLLPLSEGRSLGWPLWSLVLLAAFPLLLAGFVAVEHRGERRGRVPLVPPSLLEQPTMARGLLLALPFFTGFGGFMFVYALATQRVLGWSPIRGGLGLLPLAVVFLVTSLNTARLLPRFGGRVVISAGLLIQFAGLLLLAVVVRETWPQLSILATVPAMMVIGLGNGMVMSPLLGVVLSQVPVDTAGVGSGVLVTTQQTALALGTAGVGTLFQVVANGAGPREALLLVLGLEGAIGLVGLVFSLRFPGRPAAPSAPPSIQGTATA